jgi:RHS repeat-associated protein
MVKFDGGKLSGVIRKPLKTIQRFSYLSQQIGEPKSDRSDEIKEIIWRVDSKIAYIKRINTSTKANLGFEYDAMGNRIAKHTYTDNTFSVIKNSTYYVRDASGNTLATYEYKTEDCIGGGACYNLTERTLYGSPRLGLDAQPISMTASIANENNLYSHAIGEKHYELSNHLGNVLIVITDRKAFVPAAGTVAAHFESTIVSVTDYSPFGVPLTARTWNEKPHRYGFQNQEEDPELWEGAVTYKYRIEDPSLGRFFSVDPLYAKYPWNSNYAFSENRVLDAVELEGLEACFIHGTSRPVNSSDYRNEGPPNLFDMLLDQLDYRDIVHSRQLTENKLKKFSDLFGCKSIDQDFNWSGKDSDADRSGAALELFYHVMDNYSGDEPIVFVCHSHGGNVAIEACNMLANTEKFAKTKINLVLINTPRRSNVSLEGDHTMRDVYGINAKGDKVQMLGSDCFFNDPECDISIEYED